jgi:hypothetical protein
MANFGADKDSSVLKKVLSVFYRYSVLLMCLLAALLTTAVLLASLSCNAVLGNFMV